MVLGSSVDGSVRISEFARLNFPENTCRASLDPSIGMKYSFMTGPGSAVVVAIISDRVSSCRDSTATDDGDINWKAMERPLDVSEAQSYEQKSLQEHMEKAITTKLEEAAEASVA